MSLIRLRGGTEYEWDTAAPTLRNREVGVTTDTGRAKVGNGTTPWADLPWVGGPAEVYYQPDAPDSPENGMIWVDSDSVAFVPSMAVAEKDADYTAVDADHLVLVTAPATITLPTAVGRAGREFIVKSLTAGAVTIDTTSAETIDGQLTQALDNWEAITMISTGTEWVIV